MDGIDVAKYKKLYLRTAREYIVKLGAGLATLAQNQTDQQTIENLHIAAHSLKGQSLVMGYESTGMAAKTLEDFFADAKGGKRSSTPENLPIIQTVITKLKESIDSIERNDKEVNLTQIQGALSHSS